MHATGGGDGNYSVVITICGGGEGMVSFRVSETSIAFPFIPVYQKEKRFSKLAYGHNCTLIHVHLMTPSKTELRASVGLTGEVGHMTLISGGQTKLPQMPVI